MAKLRLPVRQSIIDAVESGEPCEPNLHELASLVLMVVGMQGGVVAAGAESRLARLVTDLMPMTARDRGKAMQRVSVELKGQTRAALEAIQAGVMDEEELLAREWLHPTGEWRLASDRQRVYRGEKGMSRSPDALFREQDAVKQHLRYFIDDHSIIKGVGGGGKTAIIRSLVDESSARKTLVLTSNPEIAYETHNVMTPGDLCYRWIRAEVWNGAVPYRQERPDTFSSIEKRYRLEPRAGYSGESIAGMVMSTVRKFCQSTDRQVTHAHTGLGNTRLAEYIVGKAESVWHDLRDTPKLKRLALHMPDWAATKIAWEHGFSFDCHTLILDELQDCSPALAEIIRRGSARHGIIAFGDEHQRLTNEFGQQKLVEYTNKPFELHQSIRCGDAIDTVVNSVRHDFPFVGNDTFGSELHTYAYKAPVSSVSPIFVPNKPVTFLTNSIWWCLVMGIKLKSLGLRFAMPYRLHVELKRLCNDILAFVSGNVEAKHTAELVGHATWDAFVSASSVYSGTREFDAWIKKQRDVTTLSSIFEYSRVGEYEISLVHDAKGREWKSICLMPDLAVEIEDADAELQRRRIYTALTRMRHICYLPRIV